MMFTEGLDETAINWVKQGVAVEQQPRSPLPERPTVLPIQDPSKFFDFDGAYPSPNRLPPLKFHSGLLGRCSIYDLEEDQESVGSATNHVLDMDLSDSFEGEEEGLGSFDWDLHNESCDEEVRSNCTRGSSVLVRSAPMKNLKVEINDRCFMEGSFSCRQKQIGHDNQSEDPMNKIITPPSAPPIMENRCRFLVEEQLTQSTNLKECYADEANEEREGHVSGGRRFMADEIPPWTKVESPHRFSSEGSKHSDAYVDLDDITSSTTS